MIAENQEKKQRMSLIAAIGSNRELGKNNTLLWNIPEDMKRFRELTTGHAVIMGQKTYESIGKPLPNRTNIIVTVDKEFESKECFVCYSLEEALEKARDIDHEEVFVIGGGSVYRQMIDKADRLYLTLVKGKFQADVFFPEYEHIFSRVISLQKSQDEHFSYEFIVLEK